MTVDRRPSVVVRPLDIGSRYGLIRRLICGHPAFKAAVAIGVDPDDLRQDVFLRLVCRQLGSGEFDPTRSSLSTYVWLVTFCSVGNYLRTQRRHRRPPADLGDQDGVCYEHGAMSPEAQLHRACGELGLDREAYEVVLEVAHGRLRRDDGRVVALGALVRERIAAP
jgi:hypothetical protein